MIAESQTLWSKEKAIDRGAFSQYSVNTLKRERLEVTMLHNENAVLNSGRESSMCMVLCFCCGKIHTISCASLQPFCLSRVG